MFVPNVKIINLSLHITLITPLSIFVIEICSNSIYNECKLLIFTKNKNKIASEHAREHVLRG